MNNTSPSPTLLRLFLVMLKIGAFTFGGGLAMLGQMTVEIADKHKWVDKETLVDLFALAQSMPGVFAVNAAFLVGHHTRKWPGALIAALGAVLPSFVTLVIVALVYDKLVGNPWADGAMRGVRAAVTALLLHTVFSLRKASVKNIFGWVLFAAAMALALFTDVNVIFILLGGGVLGLLTLLFRRQTS